MSATWRMERVNVLVCTLSGAHNRAEIRFLSGAMDTPRFLVRVERKRFEDCIYGGHSMVRPDFIRAPEDCLDLATAMRMAEQFVEMEALPA